MTLVHCSPLSAKTNRGLCQPAQQLPSADVDLCAAGPSTLGGPQELAPYCLNKMHTRQMLVLFVPARHALPPGVAFTACFTSKLQWLVSSSIPSTACTDCLASSWLAVSLLAKGHMPAFQAASASLCLFVSWVPH